MPSQHDEIQNANCFENLDPDFKSAYCNLCEEEVHVRYQNANANYIWMTSDLYRLIDLRRNESNKYERRRILKLIQKESRRALRSWRNHQIESVLNEFRDLMRLEQIDIRRTQHKIDEKPQPDDFSSAL